MNKLRNQKEPFGSRCNNVQTKNYVGDLVQNRSTTVSVTSKKRRQIEQENQIIVKNTHEAIITSDVFDAVQYQLKIRTKFITAPKKHLLQIFYSALIVEKECGNEATVRVMYAAIMHGTVKKLAVVIPLKKIYSKIRFLLTFKS